MIPSPTTERSEYDQAMALLAERMHRARDAELRELMERVDRIYAVSGENAGWDDMRWTVSWWQERSGVAVLHLVPGPAMLDLLLPPAIIGGWLDRARGI